MNNFTNAYKTKTQTIKRLSPSNNNFWGIGLDIGYSAVKVMSPNKIVSFPAYAKKISSNRPNLKEAEETDIRYRDSENVGTEWIVGDLAFNEANSTDSISELFGRNRYYSPLFKVIARVGLGIALLKNDKGSPGNKEIKVQTGLPSKYDNDKEELIEVLSGRHTFELKVGKNEWKKFDFYISDSNIGVMPQPLGSLISVCIDFDGKQQNKNTKQFFDSNVVIFDPGFGTLDTYTVKKGNVIGVETFPELGMNEVFKRTCKDIKKIYGIDIQTPELQEKLKTGELRVVNKKKMESKIVSFEDILRKNSNEVCFEAIEKMKSVYNFFQDIDCIIATGGTYSAWQPVFDKQFENMTDLKIIPGNINDKYLSNIFANVRGYYYFLNGSK